MVATLTHGPATEDTDGDAGLNRQQIEYIANEEFDSTTEADLARIDIELYADEDRGPVDSTGRSVAESFLIAVEQSRLLTPDGEQFLFKRLNFLRFRASALQATCKSLKRPKKKTLAEIDRLLVEANASRDQIACANLRLVASIVRRLSGSKDEFDEFLAEGNTILLRAIDKFDYARGYRFSTYATHAVQRHTFRLVERTRKRRQREVTGANQPLEQTADSPPAADHEKTTEAFNAIIARFDTVLDEREQFIVCARLGLDGAPKGKTLRVIADELGLSKERVRQLFNKSVEKLAEVASPLAEFAEWCE
jgi:RNA polymerase primary sigma factor